MLLFLKNVNDGKVFYLTEKDQFLVGRKDCDLLIQDDQSISRKHAIIHLNENKVTVEDCGSKYNTLYKGEKLKSNVEVELKVGDKIQFGVSHSLYSLQMYEFITTGTLLNSSLKSKLLSDLSTIRGTYVDQWTPECTHLTLKEITLTIKFLHALIEEKPIVTPTYWTKFAERVQKKLPPPDIEQYNKVPVAEVLLNKIDLSPNPKRKILFTGKLFVFPKEKDKKKLEDLIKKAGGTSVSWEKHPIPLEDIKKSPKEFLVIQTTDKVNDPDLNEVIETFSKQGKRTIPLQEIATSIVVCSCERDCNPSFNRIAQVFPSSKPAEPTQNNALAADTESQLFTIKEFKNEETGGVSVVPDTFEDKLAESESCKAFEESEALVEVEKNFNQSVKRATRDKSQGAPSKKMKLDRWVVRRYFDTNLSSSSESGTKVKCEKTDNFLTKKTSPKKRPGEDSMSDQQNENKNFPCPFRSDNKKSKSESRSHPFNITKKENEEVAQMNKENPFLSSFGNKRKAKENASEPSASKKKKDEAFKDNILSSTRVGNVSHNLSGLSKVSRIDKDVMNHTWMSKNGTNVRNNSKENVVNAFDIEMKQFIEQFKDTVIVEVMAKVPSRPKILRDDVDESPKGKANFKIFKKVMPLRPQKTIIGRSDFTAVGPADTTAIVDSRREFHNSDDEAEVSLKVKKKIPKKFVI